MLEVGSETTGRRDVGVKRERYAALGIPEYWRFDPSGGLYHRSPSMPGAALAGDRLVNGRYEPFPIHQTDEGDYRGYSPALNLELRWEIGRLLWFDPVAQLYLPSYDEAIDVAEGRRIAAEEQRDAAQARVRELEDQIHRLQNPGQP